jgi:hypothetical protein
MGEAASSMLTAWCNSWTTTVIVGLWTLWGSTHCNAMFATFQSASKVGRGRDALTSGARIPSKLPSSKLDRICKKTNPNDTTRIISPMTYEEDYHDQREQKSLFGMWI